MFADEFPTLCRIVRTACITAADILLIHRVEVCVVSAVGGLVGVVSSRKFAPGADIGISCVRRVLVRVPTAADRNRGSSCSRESRRHVCGRLLCRRDRLIASGDDFLHIRTHRRLCRCRRVGFHIHIVDRGVEARLDFGHFLREVRFHIGNGPGKFVLCGFDLLEFLVEIVHKFLCRVGCAAEFLYLADNGIKLRRALLAAVRKFFYKSLIKAEIHSLFDVLCVRGEVVDLALPRAEHFLGRLLYLQNDFVEKPDLTVNAFAGGGIRLVVSLTEFLYLRSDRRKSRVDRVLIGYGFVSCVFDSTAYPKPLLLDFGEAGGGFVIGGLRVCLFLLNRFERLFGRRHCFLLLREEKSKSAHFKRAVPFASVEVVFQNRIVLFLRCL